MVISPAVFEAGAMLLKEIGPDFPKSPIIVSAPERIEYPDDLSLRKLVGGEIRRFLEREDIGLILGVFAFSVIPRFRPCIIGGTEIRVNGLRHDYGFDGEGPFREVFKARQFRPKCNPISSYRISPEELSAHLQYPATFMRRICDHLDAVAQKIMQDRRKRRE